MSVDLGPSFFGAPLGLVLVVFLVIVLAGYFAYLRIRKNVEAVRRRRERERAEEHSR